MTDEAFEQIESNIKKLVDNRKMEGKTIAVFGSLDSVKAVICILTRYKLKVSFALNNDPKIKSAHGVPVFLPEKACVPFNENLAVLIASGYYDEMKEQLERMGYAENKHIHNINEYAKQMRQDRIKDFSEIRKQAEDGFKLYKRIIAQYGERGRIPRCDGGVFTQKWCSV